MRWCALLPLLWVATVVVATSEPYVLPPPLPDDLQCVGNEGDQWRKDCNWCSCTDGKDVCSRRQCSQGVEDEAPKCRGQPVWREDCNTCHCDGDHAVCTYINCDQPGPQQKQETVTIERTVDRVCVDGSRWRVDCNWCTCVEGKSHCTEAACTNWDEVQARKDGALECHGSSRWKKDCNWCKCANGNGVCTKRGCLTGEVDPFKDLPQGATCVPGSRFKFECNWCTCSDTGVAGCTLRGCLPGYKSDGPTCEEGAVWKSDDCNVCRCVDGASACTKRLCGGVDPFKDLPKEAVCVPGSRFKVECNWCTCSSTGVAGCTFKGCPLGYKSDGPTCEEGAVWKSDDCNVCRCVDGASACTKKLCASESPPPPPPPPQIPQCKGTVSDRWRKDCNWCSCRNGVEGCTRRLCPQGVQREGQECEGKPSWMKDCNRCICYEGKAVCTRRLCGREQSVRPSIHRGVVAPRQEPECQGDPETDFWTYKCNRCRCVNGVGSCTKRMCRGGEVDAGTCGGNPVFMKECNRCFCHNGTAICTTKFCGPLRNQGRTAVAPVVTKSKKIICVDGSRWRVQCNWCTCHSGAAVCSKRDCLGQHTGIDEPECEGDATWKQDCNWCTCGDGLSICTRMACLEEDKTPCIEGVTWRKDCNICRCSNGFTLCTKKACFQGGKQLGCGGVSCETSQLPAICHLPPVNGPIQCTAFINMWTFSKVEGRCQQIVYGGCAGTENLFDTQTECEAVCPSTSTNAAQTKHTFATSQSAEQGSERCSLPKESGPCFALFHRFAYNAKSGRCEKFVYGGCEGNTNNFESEEECLDVCGKSRALAACDNAKCPWFRWDHYLAKQCVPQYSGDSCCPTSFQCPSASESAREPNKCYYRGVSYALGDSVEVKDPCSVHCRCSLSYDPNSPPEVRCVTVECPELFQPPRPGCRPIYSADRCCAVEHVCVGPDAPPLESRANTCSWKNKTFQQGSRMYFDDYPCQSCICGPDFTNPKGPGCTKTDCAVDLRYSSELHRGCAPIYFEGESCCPIDWLCPDSPKIESQQQQQQQQQTGTSESPVCHLGNNRLAVGQALSLTECKIECRCLTPPELTCVQYRSCEAATQTAADRACPPLECASGCLPVLGDPGSCPTCSCSPDTFSCPAHTCPSNCQPEVDLQSGCPTCKCECPTQVECPVGCLSHTLLDEASGCPQCECKPGSQRSPNPEPCPLYPRGEVPCPQDCALNKTTDENGCQVCICDTNNPGNPFGPPPPPVQTSCPGEGEAPCPMDCAIERKINADGCEVCQCDPDNPGNPFGPPPPRVSKFCPGEGEAPCPMDCAILRFKDEDGCEVCKCDPDDPSSPFLIPFPPQRRVRRSCPGKYEAPCPMDCGIIRYPDNNGCWVCKCDPSNPGNPFGPPRRPYAPLW